MDRNIELSFWGAGGVASLSARRAWIEIFTRNTFAYVSYVALRKESVDRNDVLAVSALLELSRSPQGERG